MQVGEALVQDGATATVPLRTHGPVLTAVPSGQPGDVDLSIRYRGPIAAPIAAGDAIGTLRVSVAGGGTHDIPLYAGASVERANAFQRLWNGVIGFLT